VQELVALAKSKPGTLHYGTGAGGGSLHLAGEMFMLATNTKLTRVPYKNEVQMVFATAGAVVSHMKDGKLKALGVTTIKPSPLIPGVPTIASQGLRDYDLDTIGFIVGPAKMPQPLVRKLHGHVVQILRQPDVKERLAAGGSEPVTSSTNGFPHPNPLPPPPRQSSCIPAAFTTFAHRAISARTNSPICSGEPVIGSAP
jgi:tripartite-type tricarboxylate transporter receptor subunit TctC